MTLETIVVHLDGGSRCQQRVDLALALARRHGARLLGIAATGRPDLVLTLDAGVPDSFDVAALSMATLRSRAEHAAADFERRGAGSGGVACEARVIESAAVEALVGHGRCADLVVVGQADRGEPIDGVGVDFAAQAVLLGAAPVLVVPCAGRFETAGQCVVVAWKDTREAARALRDALPLLRLAEAVVLIEVGEVGEVGEVTEVGDGSAAGRPVGGRSRSLDDARRYLALHGIEAEARAEVATGEAGEIILSRACDFSADLIVMGGYGHSRVREWLLGGVTRHLLAHMTVPTLLSH